jgi:protein SCO1/2
MRRSQTILFNRKSSILRQVVLKLALAMLVAAAKCGPQPIAARTLSPSMQRLPVIALRDQHDHQIVLSSLSGQFVLLDFIYTTCPGPCLVTTARMRSVGSRLHDLVGAGLTLVSLTVDPEHDGPSQLLGYARDQGAERPGWLFLTGTPAAIDQVMGAFNLAREREPDGLIDHIVYLFLIGPDGHELTFYNPGRATPEAIAASIRRTIALYRRQG